MSNEQKITIDENKSDVRHAVVVFDPFGLIVEIFNDLYPDTPCEIIFSEGLHKGDGDPWGCTTFPDDGSDPQVVIDVETPLRHAVEILAHELAHVAVGGECDEEHGEDWEKAFSAIHQEYVSRVTRSV